MRQLVRIFAGWLALAACGGTDPPLPAPRAAPAQAGHVPGTVCGVTPRDDDRCSVLRDPLDERDVDGCPDLMLMFEPGAASADRQPGLVGDLASEMKRIERLSELRIVASGAPDEPRALLDQRIDQVVDALVAQGIERARFSRAYEAVGAGPGSLHFVPVACDGAPITAAGR